MVFLSVSDGTGGCLIIFSMAMFVLKILTVDYFVQEHFVIFYFCLTNRKRIYLPGCTFWNTRQPYAPLDIFIGNYGHTPDFLFSSSKVGTDVIASLQKQKDDRSKADMLPSCFVQKLYSC
ncbi:hypothetical protein CHARACLAT_018286 [Characodon lateralis]|uniref:Uncharacterized protein n=1 Tax=Characodon lateralis TaxID=208331 RepID=A0ABU7EV89_9TELE|nr:hypothetical protein [Characodon lateralis]